MHYSCKIIFRKALSFKDLLPWLTDSSSPLDALEQSGGGYKGGGGGGGMHLNALGRSNSKEYLFLHHIRDALCIIDEISTLGWSWAFTYLERYVEE